MKVPISFGDKVVTLSFNDFDDNIDVEELLCIEYSNIAGEIVTVSSVLNKIGLLKAESEADLSRKKLDCEIYAANLSKKYRREANINSGKFSIRDEGTVIHIKLTEDAINSAIILDPIYQEKKKGVIEAQKNSSFMDSLYWGIQSKDRKLSLLLKPVTPEEFYDELIEGVVNTILIKKKKVQ